MSYVYSAIAAATLISAGIQQKNQKQQLQRQDNALAAGIARSRAAESQNAADVQNTARAIKNSDMQDQVHNATQKYLSDLQSGGKLGTVQTGQVAPATGALSAAYQQAAGAANDATTAQATKTAGLLGITDAAGLQRTSEGNLITSLGNRVAGVNMAGGDALAQARLKAQGIQQNPWMNLLAAGLSSAASAGGAKAGAGGASTGTDTSQALGQGGSVLAGDNYTGPGSFSTDYTSNLKKIYGV